MPQIQVLPPAPSRNYLQEIGEKFGEGLSQGIAASLSQHLENKQQQKEASLVSEALKDVDFSNPHEIAARIIQLPIRDESKRLYGNLAAFGYRANREHRLQTQGVYDQYRKAISEINSEIKETPLSKDKNRLLKQRDSLKKELSLNHRLLREGKQPVFDVYESLGIEDMQEEQMPEQSPKVQAPKSQPQVSQKPKRKLTEQVVRHFLKQANNDVKEAKKLAFDQGFE